MLKLTPGRLPPTELGVFMCVMYFVFVIITIGFDDDFLWFGKCFISGTTECK